MSYSVIGAWGDDYGTADTLADAARIYAAHIAKDPLTRVYLEDDGGPVDVEDLEAAR